MGNDNWLDACTSATLSHFSYATFTLVFGNILDAGAHRRVGQAVGRRGFYTILCPRYSRKDLNLQVVNLSTTQTVGFAHKLPRCKPLPQRLPVSKTAVQRFRELGSLLVAHSCVVANGEIHVICERVSDARALARKDLNLQVVNLSKPPSIWIDCHKPSSTVDFARLGGP